MGQRKRERALVRRMVAGDEAAFEEFTDAYLPGLYRFAARRLHGDRELTREVVQSTVCKAIAKIRTFRGDAALMTWLCACCRNEIAAHFRRSKRAAGEVEFDEVQESAAGVELASGFDGPERAALRKESAELVHQALDALPPHYGKALEWKYLENLSVKEIAGRLELGPKAAESLLTRARQAFREGYGRLAASARPAVEPAGFAPVRTEFAS